MPENRIASLIFPWNIQSHCILSRIHPQTWFLRSFLSNLLLKLLLGARILSKFQDVLRIFFLIGRGQCSRKSNLCSPLWWKRFSSWQPRGGIFYRSSKQAPLLLHWQRLTSPHCRSNRGSWPSWLHRGTCRVFLSDSYCCNRKCSYIFPHGMGHFWIPAQPKWENKLCSYFHRSPSNSQICLPSRLYLASFSCRARMYKHTLIWDPWWSPQKELSLLCCSENFVLAEVCRSIPYVSCWLRINV